MNICKHVGCTNRGVYGFENQTCSEHYTKCTVCDSLLSLASPAGDLCADHLAQANAIETDGPYPSYAAIRQVIEKIAIR